MTETNSPVSESARGGERLDPARLRGLIATNVGASVAFAAMYSTQPVLPQIGQDFHVGAATAGLTLLAVTFALAFASPAAGRLSDRFDMRRVMLICSGALTVLSALAAIAPTFALLVAVRAAQGLVIPGISVTGLAYLHNDLPASWRGRVSGFYIGANTLGGLVGRLGVGLLVSAITWRGGMAVIAGVVALGTLILVVGMPRSAPGSRWHMRRDAPRADPSLRVIAARLWWAPLIGAVVFFPFITIFTYTPYRLEGPPFRLPPSTANLFYLVYLLGAVAALSAGNISDRIGRRTTIYLGLALCALGLALCLVDLLPVALLALALVCMGGLSSHVVANASVSDGANPLGAGARATALSLYTMGFYIGGGLGAFIPGFGWEHWGWPGVVAPSAVAALCAAVVALKTPRRHGQAAESSIEPVAAS